MKDHIVFSAVWEHTGKTRETCTEAIAITEVRGFGGLDHDVSSGVGKNDWILVIY